MSGLGGCNKTVSLRSLAPSACRLQLARDDVGILLVERAGDLDRFAHGGAYLPHGPLELRFRSVVLHVLGDGIQIAPDRHQDAIDSKSDVTIHLTLT